ncbi:MAG: DUF6498-containing protein [Parcubacteria group bacterium]
MKNPTYILFPIGANLIPLIGTIFLDWDVMSVLIIYWFESIVIGIISAIKLLLLKGKSWEENAYVILYIFVFPGVFFIYFEIIKWVAGIVQGRENGTGSVIAPDTISFLFNYISFSTAFALAVLAISHYLSFSANYLRNKKYQTYQPQIFKNMINAPYRRLFIMHVVLWAGGLLSFAIQSFVVVLVLLKILVDIMTFLVEYDMIDKQRLANSPRLAQWVEFLGGAKQ